MHKGIQLSDFLVTYSGDFQFVLKLKLSDFSQNSLFSSNKSENNLSTIELPHYGSEIHDNRICSTIELDLYSLGIMLLQLDSIISLDTS